MIRRLLVFPLKAKGPRQGFFLDVDSPATLLTQWLWVFILHCGEGRLHTQTGILMIGAT